MCVKIIFSDEGYFRITPHGRNYWARGDTTKPACVNSPYCLVVSLHHWFCTFSEPIGV